MGPKRPHENGVVSGSKFRPFLGPKMALLKLLCNTSSFRHKKDSSKTELWKHIWKLKSGLYHQMVNFKTRYFVHGAIKTLQFMFGRKILHFERHKQRQFIQ
jgi:hypothetical protein